MKDELERKIKDIYENLNQHTEWVLKGKRQEKYESFIKELCSLEKQLSLNPNNESIYDIKEKILILELESKQFKKNTIMLPYIITIYFGTIATYFLISFFDIPSFIQKTLGVSAPEKLISFGISGALIFLATSILLKSNKNNGVIEFSIRILLAILVPIILVALLFSNNGELLEFKVTPELISFICGYSAKLVVELLNKLVEKVSTMIQSI